MDLPTIDEARALVLARVRPGPAEDVPVAEALGRVLAEDVVAAHDVPRFANSAMDGFALRPGPAGRRLALVGESRAGTPYEGAVGDGEAVRISTGAAVPADAGAVLQLELVEDHGDAITTEDAVVPGRNVRPAGDDLVAGTTVLGAGAVLGPAELGVAVTAGRATLRCARRPRVAIVATGDELREPGAPLGPGQLHESNSVTLAALAQRAGAEVLWTAVVEDTQAATEATLRRGLEAADVVVGSGGVSVGPHDHVKPALLALGVEEVLWRVALRPGKPTWFGVRDDVLVFGLPGNPVSAMVTFLLFVRPALLARQGAAALQPRTSARLAAPLPRNPGRDECVRVRRRPDGAVEPTGPQGSHQLTSMLGADALAIVPRGEGELPAGAEVELEQLP